jgi:hypothetical protein
MTSLRLRARLLTAMTGLVLFVAACGEPFGLPVTRIENVIDTVSLFALDGTPVATPSAYQIETSTPVRTDRSGGFDFAFNITATGTPVLLPTGALGLTGASGLQRSQTAFDSVTIAPGGGWVLDSAVAADSGAVVLARSRLTVCTFGASVFYYAKLNVLRVDTAARRIDFEILVDPSCGYRGLEPGVPRR